MEQTVVWIALGVLAVLLAARRWRPEMPAAAVLLLLLAAGVMPIDAASRGLAEPGLLLLVAVSLFAEGMSPATRALRRRCFAPQAEGSRPRLLATAVFAAVASALTLGSRVIRDVASRGPAADEAATPDEPGDAQGRLLLLHACLLGGLLSLLGNVSYPLAGETLRTRFDLDDPWGMFGLAPMTAAAVGACALLAVLGLGAGRAGAGTVEKAAQDEPAPDGGWPILAALFALGWLLFVVEGYIASPFFETVGIVLSIAASLFLGLAGRRMPLITRGLLMAIVLLLVLVLEVPFLIAIGGAAVVLAALPARAAESPAARMDWSVIALFALLWPVSVTMDQTGIAGEIAQALIRPLPNAVGLTATLAIWMAAVMCVANACGAIFTLTMLMPIGIAAATEFGLDTRLFVSLLAVGTAAAPCAPDLWGKRMRELGLSPRTHWRTLLAVQAIILAAAVPVAPMLFD